MNELVCTNKECATNKSNTCAACNGKKQNFRGQRCLECNGKGKIETDRAFILVTIEMSTWDWELDQHGNIGDNLTQEEDEDTHPSAFISEIRCRECNEVVEIPKGWIGSDAKYKTQAGRARQLQQQEMQIPGTIAPDTEKSNDASSGGGVV